MGNSCSFSHIHMALSFDKFFSSKNREGIQPSMLVKKNSGQYGAMKDVKKKTQESNVNLFGFPLMQKSEWLSHLDSHFWSHQKQVFYIKSWYISIFCSRNIQFISLLFDYDFHREKVYVFPVSSLGLRGQKYMGIWCKNVYFCPHSDLEMST